MSYLVHVLFKPYNLSNVGAQNQSLFKQCKKFKIRKHFQIRKLSSQKLTYSLSLKKSYLIQKLSILVDISNLSCTGVKSSFTRAVISRQRLWWFLKKYLLLDRRKVQAIEFFGGLTAFYRPCKHFIASHKFKQSIS